MTILIGQTRERIEIRTIGNEQSIVFERRFELSRLKVVLERRAREERDAPRWFADAFFDVPHDPHEVFFEAGAFFTLNRITLDPLRELFAHERQEVAFAMFVDTSVEVE